MRGRETGVCSRPLESCVVIRPKPSASSYRIVTLHYRGFSPKLMLTRETGDSNIRLQDDQRTWTELQFFRV